MESKYLALEEQYQGLREDYANQEQVMFMTKSLDDGSDSW
jgi:hypothetical protein